MNRRIRLQIFFFVTLPLVICLNVTQGQSLPCNDLPSPQLSDDQQIKVYIDSVEFPGEQRVTEAERSHITDEIQKVEIDVAHDEPTDNWVNELQEAKHVLQDIGYFRVTMTLTPHLLIAKEKAQHYVISVEIDPGPQYRLGNMSFEDVTRFKWMELRKVFDLKEGDLFDVSKIRLGLQNIEKLYAAKGYVDATVEPKLSINEKNKQIDITFKIAEEKQYHVRSVEILGLSSNIRNALGEMLVPGKVFDQTSLNKFLNENRSLLPVSGVVENHIKIIRNHAGAYVDITLDFLACSKAQTSS